MGPFCRKDISYVFFNIPMMWVWFERLFQLNLWSKTKGVLQEMEGQNFLKLYCHRSAVQCGHFLTTMPLNPFNLPPHLGHKSAIDLLAS